MKRGEGKSFRCDHCKRLIRWGEGERDHTFREEMSGRVPGIDAGNSHWFCERCLDMIETLGSIIEARYDRRGHRISSDALMEMVCARLGI